MKAIRMHHYGGPEVLHVEKVDAPRPAANEVLVRLRAAALNHVDIDIRDGVSRFDFSMPHILGIEGSGDVVEVGHEITSVDVGDRVAIDYIKKCGTCAFCISGKDNLCENRALFGEHIDGTYTEYIAVPARSCIPLADSLSYEWAAASMVAFGTAWHALLNVANIRAGETVLINSVGSGVASAALQIARLAGAIPIVTASSAAKLRKAEALGVLAAINYTEADVAAVVLEVTSGRGVDVVFDVVGGDTFVRSLRLLAPEGRVICIGAHAGEQVPLDLIELFRNHSSIRSSHTQTATELRAVFAELEHGRLQPEIGARFALDEAARAHELLESRQVYGKVLLIME